MPFPNAPHRCSYRWRSPPYPGSGSPPLLQGVGSETPQIPPPLSGCAQHGGKPSLPQNSFHSLQIPYQRFHAFLRLPSPRCWFDLSLLPQKLHPKPSSVLSPHTGTAVLPAAPAPDFPENAAPVSHTGTPDPPPWSSAPLRSSPARSPSAC